jgi:predicted 3-demethylubiquinone-9 3-methyltransferase (glyoxalase superfamily)
MEKLDARSTGSLRNGHDVVFELDEQPFTALNGGPMFKFNEAISFQVCVERGVKCDRPLGGPENVRGCREGRRTYDA